MQSLETIHQLQVSDLLHHKFVHTNDAPITKWYEKSNRNLQEQLVSMLASLDAKLFTETTDRTDEFFGLFYNEQGQPDTEQYLGEIYDGAEIKRRSGKELSYGLVFDSCYSVKKVDRDTPTFGEKKLRASLKNYAGDNVVIDVGYLRSDGSWEITPRNISLFYFKVLGGTTERPRFMNNVLAPLLAAQFASVSDKVLDEYDFQSNLNQVEGLEAKIKLLAEVLKTLSVNTAGIDTTMNAQQFLTFLFSTFGASVKQVVAEYFETTATLMGSMIKLIITQNNITDLATLKRTLLSPTFYESIRGLARMPNGVFESDISKSSFMNGIQLFEVDTADNSIKITEEAHTKLISAYRGQNETAKNSRASYEIGVFEDLLGAGSPVNIHTHSHTTGCPVLSTNIDTKMLTNEQVETVLSAKYKTRKIAELDKKKMLRIQIDPYEIAIDWFLHIIDSELSPMTASIESEKA